MADRIANLKECYMAKKDKHISGGMVYSTNPDAMRSEESNEPAESLPPQAQKLRVKLDNKGRAGKTLTAIEGFAGTDTDLSELGKRLKAKCGTGGSVKDGAILIQGDWREKISAWLKEWGYGVK